MRAALAIFGFTAVLAACETDGGHLLTYAAQGTEIQAERVVAAFIGMPSKAAPYAGGDMARPLARMQQRWPQLRVALDGGQLGITDDGMLAMKRASPAPELKAMMRAENLDRILYYRAFSATVGHGAEVEHTWLAVTQDEFGKAWEKQAPTGWWLRDADGNWRRK